MRRQVDHPDERPDPGQFFPRFFRYGRGDCARQRDVPELHGLALTLPGDDPEHSGIPSVRKTAEAAAQYEPVQRGKGYARLLGQDLDACGDRRLGHLEFADVRLRKKDRPVLGKIEHGTAVFRSDVPRQFGIHVLRICDMAYLVQDLLVVHDPEDIDESGTADPLRLSGAQHLQNYESYSIITYFDSLRPGHNGGGWVDSGGSQMGMDRYAEQLWLTMFAKAPEMALFDYRQLIGVNLNPAVYRTPWQGQGTSFDWDEMMKPYKGVTPTTLARVAGYVFEKIDPIVGQLGNPKGIVSYKAFHTGGDDFLQDYLGMIGLPMDIRSEFPTDQKMVLLTEQAKGDPDLVKKIDAQLHRGGSVVITSGLLEAIPDKIAQFVELTIDGHTLVDDFGRYGKADREFIIPEIGYFTNDSWELISAGRPLTKGTSGWPILHRGKYSNGYLYVLTIPEDFSDLYHYPVPALNAIRTFLSPDMKARLEGPALVSIFEYDNDKVIVESFRDETCSVFVCVGDRKIPVVLKPHSFELVDIK